MSKTIEIAHIGGSRKIVEVLGSDAGSYPRLLIHWPTAGMYVIDLKTNTLRQADCVMNRRKALPWYVVDLPAARALWKEYRAARLAALRPLVKGQSS